MRIAIAGAGHVGLVTAAALAAAGHRVICVDKREDMVQRLSKGQVPMYEQGLSALMRSARPRLEFTSCPQGYKNASAVLICVGTPEKQDAPADLNDLYEVAEQIAQFATGYCVAAVRSTVPVGVCDGLEAFMRSRAKDGCVDVASNPEFLSQGQAVRGVLRASRIVIGTNDKRSAQVLRQVYAPLKRPMIFTDRRSAELAKYASNGFLAVKLSYINELANLCACMGANVDGVLRILEADPRMGKGYMRPGPGYGGSCLPKDARALIMQAREAGQHFYTLEGAIKANSLQREMLMRWAEIYGGVSGKKAAVLGLSFKAGTDDTRCSPAGECVEQLLLLGAQVRVYDPVAAVSQAEGVVVAKDALAALDKADLCFIFSDWPQIRALRPADFINSMARCVVLDGRNCYPPEAMSALEVYASIGRPVTGTLVAP